MKKILSFLISIILILCSVSGVITVSASAEIENLWANISVDDFGSNDQSPPNSNFGFEQYNDGAHGKAFNIKSAWYTSFYIKLPDLDVNAEYNISFYYDNIVTETAGSILKVDLLTAEEIATADDNGYVKSNVGTRLGTNLALDKGEWSLLEAKFTTKSEDTDYYLNIQTNYAYWLRLTGFKLVSGDVYSISVSGGTSDVAMAKYGATVTVTATPAEGQTFMGWVCTSGNVTFADPTATTTTFSMPNSNVSIKAKYDAGIDLESTPMPNLLADMSVSNFGSKDQTPTTTDFGFTAHTDGKYKTKYKITNSYYTTFYVSLPKLKANTEYYISFRYDNDIQVVTPGNIEAIHVLNESQLAAVDANGKVTDNTIPTIGKNIPLDQGGWSLFSAYFKTSSEDTNYYINVKTGYAYNLYVCDFVLKETVVRPVVVEGGTADKETAKVGEKITITATPTASQKFMGWNTVVGDVELVDPLATTTTFLMPDSAVSVKAGYYENLLENIDATYFGTNDQTPNSNFKFEQYNDGKLGTAFNIYSAYYTTFYIKLPPMEVNEQYNLSIWYDNSIDANKVGSIQKIDLLTAAEIGAADAGGKVTSAVGKRLGTNIALDKGKWSGFHVSFTPEEETDYYLNIETNYAYLLRLTGFNLVKNFSKGMTITGGYANNPFALEGETVEITADLAADKTFSYWKVVSGDVAIANPYSQTSTFAMGIMAPMIEAVYLGDEIKIEYYDIDGAPYTNSMSSVHKATLTDNKNGTSTAKIDLYTYDGAYVFKGWYKDNTLLSTDLEYTFNTSDLDITKLKAKVISLNLIDGDPGFESYSTGDTVRVDPPNSGVLPYNDKWGIWSRYAAADRGFVAGYENLDWSYSIRAFNGQTTDYYKNYTYSPETATYSLDSANTTYTIKPYCGDSMIGFAVKSRSAVRKLQNLKPNTQYQISFYVSNPSKTDLLKRIVVANTYDLDAGSVKADTQGVYAFFEDYDGYSDYDKTRNWGKMTITFTTPENVTEAYLHFGFSTTNSHSSQSKVFIDNLICVPTVFSYAGNAIRKSSAQLPQALRYKFFVDNATLESFGSMDVTEIGILAIENSVLGDKELVLNGEYEVDGKIKTPGKGIVTLDNIQSIPDDAQHSYFTAALYNIGKTFNNIDYSKYSSDYTVRSYLKLQNPDGGEIILYSAQIDASVFAVIHEIYSARDNKSDREAADEIMVAADAKTAFAKFEPKDEFFVVKDAVTDYAFSIAVVGDPQKTTYFHPEDLHYSYDWIVENAEKNNTQYVITLGDITEYSTQAEYDLVEEQLKKIEDAKIPQVIVRGNHDRTADFDANITKAEYGTKLTGSYDNTLKNVYQIITMGGQKYLIMVIDYYDQLTNAIVDWAAGIIAANPDCRVILNTHGLLSTTMQTYTNKMVQYLHNNLIMKYENIDLVLCGHDIPFGDDGPVYKTITGNSGNKIVEMMINPQTLEEQKREGFGLVSTLYFGNDGKTVTVEWYSTIRNAYYMQMFQFSFELE